MTGDTAGITLCLSGHDPSGGAGIQADIETLNSLGGHAASLITCLTVQNSQGLQQLQPIEPDLLRQQAELLTDDMPIAAIKIGALGSAAVAEVAVELVKRIRGTSPDLPVVLDPVVAAGGGGLMADAPLLTLLREQLLPLVSIATPNQAELTALGGTAAALNCDWVLVTGTDSTSAEARQITHWLHRGNAEPQAFHSPRLPQTYHGSGCTLAAALAHYLAQGLGMPDAVQRSLDYCQQCLNRARPLGQGQWFPHRQPPET